MRIFFEIYTIFINNVRLRLFTIVKKILMRMYLQTETLTKLVVEHGRVLALFHLMGMLTMYVYELRLPYFVTCQTRMSQYTSCA